MGSHKSSLLVLPSVLNPPSFSFLVSLHNCLTSWVNSLHAQNKIQRPQDRTQGLLSSVCAVKLFPVSGSLHRLFPLSSVTPPHKHPTTHPNRFLFFVWRKYHLSFASSPNTLRFSFGALIHLWFFIYFLSFLCPVRSFEAKDGSVLCITVSSLLSDTWHTAGVSQSLTKTTFWGTV